MDFPLVTTFRSHAWFRRSASSFLPGNNEFSNFYFWKQNAKTSEFVSRLSDSSLYYFHRKNRPDLPILNWHYSNVSRAIKKALSFWVQKDIDGFHFSDIDYLYRTADGLHPTLPQHEIMPWSKTKNAGFSDAVKDLKLNTEFYAINFDTQYSNHLSQLRIFQMLAKYRQRCDLLQNGQYYISPVVNNGFTLSRFKQNINNNSTFGNEVLIVTVNFGEKVINQTLLDIPPIQQRAELEEKMFEAKILVATTSSNKLYANYYYKQRLQIFGNQILVGPNQAIVFLISF